MAKETSIEAEKSMNIEDLGNVTEAREQKEEISAEDASRLGIEDMQSIRITSRRGEMIAKAEISDRVPLGLIFANFHFPDDANVNNLTIGELDPIAKIPEYKVCAVRIDKDS